jgi:hypothetical protein
MLSFIDQANDCRSFLLPGAVSSPQVVFSHFKLSSTRIDSCTMIARQRNTCTLSYDIDPSLPAAILGDAHGYQGTVTSLSFLPIEGGGIAIRHFQSGLWRQLPSCSLFRAFSGELHIEKQTNPWSGPKRRSSSGVKLSRYCRLKVCLIQIGAAASMQFSSLPFPVPSQLPPPRTSAAY